MDAKARFKQLQEAFTAGYLDNAEFNELRAALLSIMHRNITLAEHGAELGIEEGEAPPPELWKLERDLEIGPPTRRFRLMRKLGNGCQAYQTWLGEDLNRSGIIDERLRALKIFAFPHSSSDKPEASDPKHIAAFMARIKTRVELSAQLDHSQIAKVYGWRRDAAGWLFAEAEYIDHRTSHSLEKLLELQGKPGLNWGLVLELIRPVVEALTYAQRDHRLAHHNLKPATLFRISQDDVKVVDFGLNVQTKESEDNSKLTGSQPEPMLQTAASSQAGQSRFKRDVSDLCAAILQLLTGRPWTVEAQRPKLARLTKPSQLTDTAWQLLRNGLNGHSESCPASTDELLQRLETAQAIPDSAANGGSLSTRSRTYSGFTGPSTGPLSGRGEEEELFANFLYRLTSGMEIGPPERRFRLLRRLGDTGRVWLAAELQDNETKSKPHKALKVFAPNSPQELMALSGADEGGHLTRAELLNLRAALVHLRAKVEVAALLDHPNIIKVYGWRQGPDGWPFVEMDYLDNRAGFNLQEMLQREGTMSWERTLSLLQPIASALDYAHQTHRLAHRNLKPANVIVTQEDDVKLLDFGLTYQPRELREGGRAREGGEEADASLLTFKQDVSALAALAYEMLTSEPPYADEERLGRDPHTWPPMAAPQPAQKTVSANAEPDKPPGLNEAAWQIIRRCLNDQNAECPASAGELLKRLETAQAPRRSRKRHSKADQPKATKQPVAMAALLLLGLLGAGAYGVYSWYPGAKSNSATSQQALTTRTTKPALPSETNETPEQATARSKQQQIAASTEADRRAFEAAQRLDSVSAYRIYLQRCPDCSYQAEAESAIANIQQTAAENQRQEQLATLTAQLQSHLTAWERNEGQRRDRSAKAILEKLTVFDPQLPLIKDSQRRLASSYAARAEASIAAGQLSAAQQWFNEAKALQPDLPELQTLPQMFAEAQAQAQENTAFQRAQAANTRQAYLTYLDRCAPQCVHQEAALAALEKLKLRPPSASNPVFSDQLKDGSLGPELMLIQPGEFWMGSPADEVGRYADEERQQVRIPRPFGLSLREITFDEYDKFARATSRALPDDNGWGRGQQPVINVSWADAQAYVQWLTQNTGHRYRLPTEAEWEYAARAGTSTARFWGNDPNAGCRFANGSDLTAQQTFAGWTAMRCQDGYLHTAPVGSYQANAEGLHDMLGNVMELTCSDYAARRQGNINDCTASVRASHVVAKGGSWSDEPRNIRAAERFKATPQLKTNYLGFRVLREL